MYQAEGINEAIYPLEGGTQKKTTNERVSN